MKTGSAILAALAVAAGAATSAFAEQIGVQDDVAKTYTVTVGEGVTVPLSAEDAAALLALDAGYTFIKDGAGTLSVSNQIEAFDRPIVITNGIYEATASEALGVGGAGAETYVRTGASLRIAHGANVAGKVVFKYHEKISIAGTGFGGAGALFNGKSADQTGLLRNSGYLVLDDDATVGGYGLGFQGSQAFLDGHTLTVDMVTSSKPFNLTFAEVKTAGDIHVVSGRFFFDGSTTYAGGSENTVTVEKDSDLAFRNTTKAIPWSLVLAGGANLYPSSPKYDGGFSYNVWSGPVTLNGNVTVNYSQEDPTSVAIAGPVSGTGGFSVNRYNTLHLSCPTNSFSGGVSVVGSSKDCKLSLSGGNACPPDGRYLYVQNGTVVIGSGVFALPDVRFNTAGSAAISNAVPGSVAQLPNLVKNGTGPVSIYGGIAVTNMFEVNTGRVELAAIAASADNAAGLYKYHTNFVNQVDLTNYFANAIGLTFTKNLNASNLRSVFNHVVNIRKDYPTEVDGVDMAFQTWGTSEKFSMYAYTGYFRNLAPTNVTYTFVLSNWDVEGLWIDGKNLIYSSGTKSNGGTYCAQFREVTLAPGPHKMDVLLGHWTASNGGPRASAASTGVYWPALHGFALRYGAFGSVTSYSEEYFDVKNDDPLGTVLARTADPLPEDVAENPDRYRPTFANLAGEGAGTLDLGGETYTVESLGGTLTITNGALNVSSDWGATLSSIALAPLTVAANATLTFGANTRFVPDEALQHGGHTPWVVAQSSDGGTISGTPSCELQGWSLYRTDDGGDTRIEAVYAIGSRFIVR